MRPRDQPSCSGYTMKASSFWKISANRELKPLGRLLKVIGGAIPCVRKTISKPIGFNQCMRSLATRSPLLSPAKEALAMRVLKLHRGAALQPSLPPFLSPTHPQGAARARDHDGQRTLQWVPGRARPGPARWTQRDIPCRARPGPAQVSPPAAPRASRRAAAGANHHAERARRRVRRRAADPSGPPADGRRGRRPDRATSTS